MSFRFAARFALASAFAASASHAVAGDPPVWQFAGPEGGALVTLSASPVDPDFVLGAGTAHLWWSTDGGATWAPARLPAGDAPPAYHHAVAFHPTDADVAYAIHGRDRLYRTEDGGDTWVEVHRIEDQTPSASNPAQLTAVAVDPFPPYDVRLFGYRTFQGFFHATQLNSTDGGDTFAGGTRHVCGGHPSHVVYAVAYDLTQAEPRRVELAPRACNSFENDEPAGLFGVDQGLPILLRETDVDTTIARLDVHGGTYFALVSGSLLGSTNRGMTWTSLGAMDGFDAVSATVVYAADFTGIGRSADGGATFVPTSTTTAGAPYAMRSALAVAARSADAALASTAWGAAATADGGASWSARIKGLRGHDVRALERTADGTTLWAGLGELGHDFAERALFRTTDGGATWAPTTLGGIAEFVRDVVRDPTTDAAPNGPHLWAVGGGCGQTSFCPNGLGGIYASEDGGATWVARATGLPLSSGAPNIGTVRSVLLDPSSFDGTRLARVLVGAGRNSNAFAIARTQDAGAQWTSVAGLPDTSAGFLRTTGLARALDGVLYAATFSGQVLDPEAMRSGVFRSLDAGATWQHASDGLPSVAGTTNVRDEVYSVAVDPRNAARLWITIGATAPKVYASGDRAASWQDCSAGLPATGSLRMLKVDPLDPEVLYAAGTDGVWLSTDGCATWAHLGEALPFATELLVTADLVYVGTNEGVFTTTPVRPRFFADGFE